MLLLVGRPLHHAPDAAGVLEGLDVLVAAAGENLLHAGGLADAHLKEEDAPQPQGGAPLLRDVPVEVQAVIAAVQGQAGLVVPDRGVQAVNVPGGDVGRVA